MSKSTIRRSLVLAIALVLLFSATAFADTSRAAGGRYAITKEENVAHIDTTGYPESEKDLAIYVLRSCTLASGASMSFASVVLYSPSKEAFYLGKFELPADATLDYTMLIVCDPSFFDMDLNEVGVSEVNALNLGYALY